MKKFIITCLAASGFFFSKAQTIDSVLENYANGYAPEKAWLHLDKSAYNPGETMWFKAYVMENLFPAEGSKTLYVDCLADNGNVLSHIVSPLVDGTTNGQFEIPANYTGDFIHLRVYTKWMLNFDTAFLFSKDIRMLGKNPVTAKTPKPVISTTLQFFPEGGDAIMGMTNKIAFKANDQWGRPSKIKGIVQDSKGVIVDSLRVQHDGMGFFFLQPVEGQSYTAKWKDEKGTDHSTLLPPAKSTGISMQVGLNGTRRVIQMNFNNQLAENLKELHLVGTMNQRMVFRNDINTTGINNARRIIPTENLPTGILTITVFDASWNELAERISFINNHDYGFETSMDVKHWGLSKRKRNEILISIPDSLQNASLSISVTDAAIEHDTTENIISHFLLSSEIRGKVYKPSYYFSGNADSLAQHLDLVMLTNGWRRFKWDELVKGKLPVINYPKDTSYLSLSGKVFGVTKSQLSGKDNIVLMVKTRDSAMQMMILSISTNGTFEDPNIVFFDTLQVYYSLKSKFFSQAEARFMMERLPPPNYAPFSKNFLNPNPFYDTSGTFHHSMMTKEALRLQDMQKGKVMETVTVKAKQKTTTQIMDEKYASGMFRGGDGYQFDLANDPAASAYQNIFNYLQGKVAGLQISMSGGDPTLSWRGGSPGLYLDEIQSDASMISSIPVSDVAYIKVFRPPFMGGFNGGNGAIVIYTRRGDDAKNAPGKGLSNNKISGYTLIRQFYSPNYDRFDPKNDQPDVRTTLYWNPILATTQKNHSVLVSFHNNDITKSFRVVIEGMTKDGLLTHYEQIME